MKQFLTALCIVFAIIPQFFISLWLASEGHNIAGAFVIISFTVTTALVILLAHEMEIEDKREVQERVRRASL